MKKNKEDKRVITVRHNCFYLSADMPNGSEDRTSVGLEMVDRMVEVLDENGRKIFVTDEYETEESFEKNGFHREFVTKLMGADVRETFDSSFNVVSAPDREPPLDRLFLVPLSEIDSSVLFSLSTKVSNKFSEFGEAFYSAVAKDALVFDKGKYDALMSSLPEETLEKLPRDEIYLVFWDYYHNNDKRLCTMQLASQPSNKGEMAKMLVPYLFNAEWVISKIPHYEDLTPFTRIRYAKDGYDKYNIRLLDLLVLNYIGPSSVIRDDHLMTSLDWSDVESVLCGSGNYTIV